MYVCDVVVYSIQVYSKLYSLYQIIVSYKLQDYTMLKNSLQQIATDQSVSDYTLHGSVVFVFFVQSEAFLPVQLQK